MNNPDPKSSSKAGTATQAGAEAADNLRDTVHDAAGKVSSEVAGVADKARTGASQEIKQIADALHTAAGELTDGSSQRRMFDRLADNVDQVSKTMNDKNLGEMLHDLNDLARRNPMLFLGGAALAGFAASRLATASAPSASEPAASHRASSYPGDRPAATATATATGSTGAASPAATDRSRGM